MIVIIDNYFTSIKENYLEKSILAIYNGGQNIFAKIFLTDNSLWWFKYIC